jgi:hypothetical protein
MIQNSGGRLNQWFIRICSLSNVIKVLMSSDMEYPPSVSLAGIVAIQNVSVAPSS